MHAKKALSPFELGSKGKQVRVSKRLLLLSFSLHQDSKFSCGSLHPSDKHQCLTALIVWALYTLRFRSVISRLLTWIRVKLILELPAILNVFAWLGLCLYDLDCITQYFWPAMSCLMYPAGQLIHANKSCWWYNITNLQSKRVKALIKAQRGWKHSGIYSLYTSGKAEVITLPNIDVMTACQVAILGVLDLLVHVHQVVLLWLLSFWAPRIVTDDSFFFAALDRNQSASSPYHEFAYHQVFDNANLFCFARSQYSVNKRIPCQRMASWHTTAACLCTHGLYILNNNGLSRVNRLHLYCT